MKPKHMGRWMLFIITVIAAWSSALVAPALAADETLVLSVNPALAGQTTTATIAMENVADVESLSLELSFASGTILTLPASGWFTRDAYFPQSLFGAVPQVDRNDRRVIAAAGKIHISGFEPTGVSGQIGIVTFNVSPGAVTGGTQILSLTGKFYSRTEQTVKPLSPVMATFTVGSLPNIVALPTVRLLDTTEPGNQSAPGPVVVKNTGIADLVVGNLSVYGTNASEFTLETDGCSGQTIAPGESRTVQVVFAPASEGLKTAYISVPSNDPDTSTLIVPLKSTSQTIPVLDSDNDGIPDDIESAGCTDPYDADTDDDGLADGTEDVNHNGTRDTGETNPCNFDTDGDGIQDGTESGLTLAGIGPDTDTNVFQPDLDPLTTTSPLLADTDEDGVSDGLEDANHNGRVDAGEYDPLDPNSTPPPAGTIANLIDWNGNLVADFGSNGMWYHNGTTWNWMSNSGHVGRMVVWDNKLVVDFGAGKGMYYYDGSWHWMTNQSDPSLMIAWDNGVTDNLVVDWGAGNRIYTYDGTWNWFNNKDGVADMTVWNNKLIVDFGSGRGLYNYDGTWNWMSNKDDVAMMLPWNNGSTEVLVVDFGGGRRIYTYDGTWSWFTNKDDVNDMVVWNQELVVDFGGGRLLYTYNGSWNWLSNKDDVARMVVWRDTGTDLAVDFGNGRNMYNYDGSWTWIKNANNVPEMLPWNNRLVVDFGSGVGVYNFNGTWHLMKEWSTAD